MLCITLYFVLEMVCTVHCKYIVPKVQSFSFLFLQTVVKSLDQININVNVHTWHYLSVSSLPSTLTILSQMYQNIQPAVIMIITFTIIIIVILLIIINLR